jgi:hypothetical protein
VLLLVPSDPLRPRRADPHLADEAAAARELGVDVALLDHDVLVAAHDLAGVRQAVRKVPASEDVVYRGWMVTADAYARLEQVLARQGARLRTTFGQYRRGHELPGWYDAVAPFTPQACWTDGPDLDAYTRCLRTLGSGPAVLRDYTKSLKHQWHEAAFVPDVADEAGGRRVAERFLELRAEAFDGGLVLRRFESFAGAEARTWWVGGRCVLVTAHPDSPDEQPDVPQRFLAALEPAVASLGLPFVTADLVRRTDGSWRVVEMGDGQVSDRPRSCPPAELVHALLAAQGAGKNLG